MRKNLWLFLTLALAIAALVASTLLLVDYVKPAPVFCDPEGGCGAVRRTVFARPLGVPLPAIGLAGIFGLALAALVPGRSARRVQAIAGALGAFVALGLLGVQLRLQTFCPYCVVVDGAAVLLGALSIARLRRGWDPPPGRTPAVAGALTLLAAIAAPVAVGQLRKPKLAVPAPIAEELERTPRGQITLVDFADFECPFCRMTHAELAPLLAERKGKVRVARKHVPLRMHPHAMDAARAGCCGETLGKGEEMADALFKAEDLSPEGCEKLAKEIGLDVAAFRDCVKAPATAARIDKDREAFKAAKGHGLPTLWIEGTKLEGAQDRASLAAALDAAILRL